jgi:predicted metalloprotease with PDZ domain
MSALTDDQQKSMCVGRQVPAQERRRFVEEGRKICQSVQTVFGRAAGFFAVLLV